MVDSVAQLELIRAARAASPPPAPRRACASSWTPAIARWAGASALAPSARPCTPPRQAVDARPRDPRRDGLRLVGIMAYEAQIAGLGDSPPGRPLRALAIRALPSALRPRARRPPRRRRRRACASCAPLELVNGGRHRQPAPHRARASRHRGDRRLGPVRPHAVRLLPRFQPRPRRAVRAARSCADRVRAWPPRSAAATSPRDLPIRCALPIPYLPAGLRLDSQEGAGEVQTPLLGSAADELAVGRSRVVSPRQGGRAVRALRVAAPARGRSHR